MSQASTQTDSSGESIKETFESIVIAFILAFVFRAFVVEAFVIPTGSMAPTLLGANARVTCYQCGYQFAVDWPQQANVGREHSVPVPLSSNVPAVCPMCHNPVVLAKQSRPNAGDRILVHKYIYNFSQPHRWDVVVFKNPQNPEDNYIKRLVGLPQEQIMILEGNIYTRSLDARQQPDGPWRIQRKSDRPIVQRTVWQPVYHSVYVPLDGGDPARNSGRIVTPPQGGSAVRLNWSVPWQPEGRQASAWKLEGRSSYRFESPAAGRLRFDFDRQRSLASTRYPYNQFRSETRSYEHEPIEDARLALAVEPDQAGLALELGLTARWGIQEAGKFQMAAQGNRTRLVGRIDAQGWAWLQAPDLADPATGSKPWTLAKVQLSPLKPRIATELELWYVDQQLSFWVDGQRVLMSQFELDQATLISRDPLPTGDVPLVAIEISGSPATLHRVCLDRDIYYSSANPGGVAGAGAILKTDHSTTGEPLTLEYDQFYCLGDNSPLSGDSRYWRTVDEWVEYRTLQDHQLRYGIVPRELMIGRAFFVYWPAPYGLTPQSYPFLPNFAQMRFIH